LKLISDSQQDKVKIFAKLKSMTFCHLRTCLLFLRNNCQDNVRIFSFICLNIQWKY